MNYRPFAMFAMKDSTFRGRVTCRSVISRRGATGQRQRGRGAEEEEEVCGEACTPMNRATLVTLHRSIHNGGEGLLLPKHVLKKNHNKPARNCLC